MQLPPGSILDETRMKKRLYDLDNNHIGFLIPIIMNGDDTGWTWEPLNEEMRPKVEMMFRGRIGH
jgi:hypothetical protein